MSSFLNGKSKAETLTQIIRNCQGAAPVEIYTHKESNDNTGEGDSHFELAIPSFGAGIGRRGEEFGRELFGSIFEDVLEGVIGGLTGSERGGGVGGRIFGGAFPIPPPAQEFSPPGQEQAQQPQQKYPPVPPHYFDRGQWPSERYQRSRHRQESDVTEI